MTNRLAPRRAHSRGHTREGPLIDGDHTGAARGRDTLWPRLACVGRASLLGTGWQLAIVVAVAVVVGARAGDWRLAGGLSGRLFVRCGFSRYACAPPLRAHSGCELWGGACLCARVFHKPARLIIQSGPSSNGHSQQHYISALRGQTNQSGARGGPAANARPTQT